MANVNKSLGKYRDWPQLESQPFAALTAGSASDPAAGSEVQMAVIPDLTAAFPPSAVLGAGVQGSLPNNRMWLRWAGFCSQGTSPTAGNATNYADLQLLVYRFQSSNLPSGVNPGTYMQGILAYYSLKVNTTIGTAITSSNVNSVVAVTPAAMTGIVPGMLLAVGATSTYELVKVLSTTSTTFSAYFTQQHATNAAVTSVLQPNYPVPFVSAAGTVPAGATIGSLSAGTSVTATPSTMYGIHVGDSLLVDTVGSGVQETVVVQSVSLTTFKATFANNHGSNTPIQTANDARGVPQLANGPRFDLQPNDVLKLTRTSNNVTGIATPAGNFFIDWVPSQIGQ